MNIWTTKRQLKAQLATWDSIRESENARERAEAYRSGFDDAKEMFEDERKQLFQFASLAAIGNAKRDTKLLDVAIKDLNKSLEK